MVLVKRPAGKKPLGRPKRRWEGSVKMDLQEEGVEKHRLDRFGLW
jgi:hypothetical protein